LRSKNHPIDRVGIQVNGGLELKDIQVDVDPNAIAVNDDSIDGRINLQLSKEFSGPIEFTTTWRLNRETVIGNILLPQIEILDVADTHRLLAVSSSPRLVYTLNSPANTTVGTSPDEFLSAWENVEGIGSCYRILRRNVPISLAVSPAAPYTTAQPVTQIKVADDYYDIQIDADFNTFDGTVTQQRVDVSPDWVIVNASVLQDGTEMLANWNSDKQGGLNLFYKNRIKGDYSLKLVGYASMDSKDPTQISIPHFEDVFSDVGKIVLFRQVNSEVEVVSVTGLSPELDYPVSDTESRNERLIQSFESSGTSGAVTIHTKQQFPRLALRQVVILSEKGAQWQVDLDCVVDVKKGVLDELRIDIPGNMPGPFEIVTGSARVGNIEVEGGNQHFITVTFEKPINDSAHILLRTLLDSPRDYSPILGDIRVLGGDSLQRYVIVPEDIDSEGTVWQVRGLVAKQIEFNDLALDESRRSVYEVDDEEFMVSRELGSVDAPTPQIALAEFHVAITKDKILRGIASFDIISPTTYTCLLSLPTEYRLRDIFVEDIPVARKRIDSTTWRLNVSSSDSLKRVHITFSGKYRESGGRPQLFSPVLLSDSKNHDPIDVKESIWTVFDSASSKAHLTDNSTLVSMLKSSSERLVAVYALAKAVTLPEEFSQPTNLTDRWITRLGIARFQYHWARQQLDSSGDIKCLSSKDLADIDLFLRINSPAIDANTIDGNEMTGADYGFAYPWTLISYKDMPIYSLAQSGRIKHLSFELPGPKHWYIMVRAMIAGFVILLISILGSQWVRAVSRQQFYIWMGPGLAVLGIVWCVLLQPWWFGLVFLVSGLRLALWSDWTFRGHQDSPPSTTY